MPVANRPPNISLVKTHIKGNNFAKAASLLKYLVKKGENKYKPLLNYLNKYKSAPNMSKAKLNVLKLINYNQELSNRNIKINSNQELSNRNIKINYNKELSKINLNKDLSSRNININSLHNKYLKGNSPIQTLEYLKCALKHKIYEYKYDRLEKLINSLKNTKITNDIAEILLEMAKFMVHVNGDFAKIIDKILNLGVTDEKLLGQFMIHVIDRNIYDATKVLLEHGFDPNKKIKGKRNEKSYYSPYNRLNKNLLEGGEYPLNLAVRLKNPAPIYALIEYGADFNKKDANGSTPIMVAVASSHNHESVNAIIDSIAKIDKLDKLDLDSKDNSGNTVFDYIRNQRIFRKNYVILNAINKIFYVKLLQSLKKYVNKMKKNGKLHFTDPMTNIKYNINTLKQVNGNNKMYRVGAIFNSNGKLMSLTNYVRTRNAISNSNNGEILPHFHKDWKLVNIFHTNYFKLLKKNNQPKPSEFGSVQGNLNKLLSNLKKRRNSN